MSSDNIISERIVGSGICSIDLIGGLLKRLSQQMIPKESKIRIARGMQTAIMVPTLELFVCGSVVFTVLNSIVEVFCELALVKRVIKQKLKKHRWNVDFIAGSS